MPAHFRTRSRPITTSPVPRTHCVHCLLEPSTAHTPFLPHTSSRKAEGAGLPTRDNTTIFTTASGPATCQVTLDEAGATRGGKRNARMKHCHKCGTACKPKAQTECMTHTMHSVPVRSADRIRTKQTRHAIRHMTLRASYTHVHSHLGCSLYYCTHRHT